MQIEKFGYKIIILPKLEVYTQHTRGVIAGVENCFYLSINGCSPHDRTMVTTTRVASATVEEQVVAISLRAAKGSTFLGHPTGHFFSATGEYLIKNPSKRKE